MVELRPQIPPHHLMPALRRGTKYNYAHQQRRKACTPAVATGTVHCVFANVGECREDNPLIQPGQPWDWDHTHQGPAHAGCNRAAGNRAREPRTNIW